MKLTKKLIGVLMVTTMIGSLLGGCASKQELSDATTNTQKEESNSQTAEKANVVIWNMSLKDKESQKIIMEDFYKTYDNIEIEFKELPEGTSQEVSQKLVTELVGGSKIDIFDVNQAEYFQMAQKGLYQPLGTYISESNFDANVLGTGNVEMSMIDNELYGLPYVQSKFLLYYNKDLFDQAGVAYPTNDWTWDDFREAAKQLTSGEGADKIWGATMPWYPCTWTGMASQTGVRMVDGTKANFDNPVFKEALQFKYDLTMVDKSSPSLAENKTTKAHWTNEFSSGKTAMLIGPEWGIGSIAKNLNNEYPFEYDLAYIPHPEGVEPGTTFGAPRYIGMNGKASDEQKAATWEVLQYLATSEVVAFELSKNGATPALLTENVSKNHLKNVPEFVQNEDIIFEDSPRVEEKAAHILSNQVEQIVKEEGELAFSDAKSIDEAIATIQKRLTEELARGNK